jgi:1-pyrroline-5-carboxylate dehydrogenase
MGSPEEREQLVSAVIHENSFDKLAKDIDAAKASAEAEVIVGGGYDKSVGWFIEPTQLLTTNPDYETLTTELFGPVLTIYVYEDAQWAEP